MFPQRRVSLPNAGLPGGMTKTSQPERTLSIESVHLTAMERGLQRLRRRRSTHFNFYDKGACGVNRRSHRFEWAITFGLSLLLAGVAATGHEPLDFEGKFSFTNTMDPAQAEQYFRLPAGP